MISFASTSIWLSLAFGLRHGLEADHVVVIDALTLRASTARERWAPWIGLFFALGHGMTVLAVCVSMVLLSSNSPDFLSNSFLSFISWLPIVILSALGVSNLIGLMRHAPYRMQSWKHRLLPRQLRNSSNPWVIVAIGILFALVIDSFIQGAMLAAIALAHGGVVQGLLLGLVFMGGMMISETADSHLVFRAIGGHDEARIQRRQRVVGMLIVVLSFGTVAFALMEKFGLHPVYGASSAVPGVLLIALIALVWLLLRRAERLKLQAPTSEKKH